MSKPKICMIRLSLVNGSEVTFLPALDEAGISHGQILQFTTDKNPSVVVEGISAVMEAMPWNAIAKIVIAWIKAKSDRKVKFIKRDGEAIEFQGYSAEEVTEILKSTEHIALIDFVKDQ